MTFSKKFILSFVLIALLVLIVFLVFSNLKLTTPKINYASDLDSLKAEQITKAKELLKLKEDDVFIGNIDAPIQIVSLDSYSCYHCANFFTKIFPQIKREYIDTGKVLFIHREFSLDAPSLTASKLARCYIQKKQPNSEQIFSLISSIYQSQTDWTSNNYEEKIVQIFEIAGLTKNQSAECLKDEAIENKILQDRQQYVKVLNIQGTPTFFINGTVMTEGYDFQSFALKIEGILKQK